MEDNKPHNPNAFPLIADDYIQEGMTLRDYFAAKAIQGIFSSQTELRALGAHNDIHSIYALVGEAFLIADAMLKEREKNV